jgi:S1-C subfamily serine protease
MKISAALALCVALAQPVFGASVDPTVEAARKILAQHQDSVLWISAVCKISVSAEGESMPEREQKVLALGTVLGTNGLLVTSMSSIDPTREINGREVQTRDGTRARLEASAVHKDVQIVMPDGTEVPAEVVLKDMDLDLAFIRAKASSKEFASAVFKPVDLKDNAKAIIAEETVSLGRMDEVFNRQPAVFCGQVNSIVTKPRQYLRVGSAGVGTPTFNTDGKLIGIGVLRRMQGKGVVPAVMPATDILDIAEQAKNAKPIAIEEKAKASEKPAAKSGGMGSDNE